MPLPLKKGFNVHIEYIEKPFNYVMRAVDIYQDFYGIGMIISGDRQTTTPEQTCFIHAGNVTPMNIGVYHQTQIKVRQMFEDMLYEYEHYDSNSEFIIEGILGRLIITLLREGKVKESAEMKLNIQDKAIYEVLAYLDLHYAENPSVETLAALAGLSASHFMKRFRECTGSSYKTYLKCYKIRLAQSLLLHTEHSISRISEELGFCNSNYFCNVFHEIYGKSPRAFRKEHRHS